MHTSTIRTLWVLMETIHSIIYFAPEKVDAYNAAGLRGGWMGYFASRSAAMGPVGAEVVTATFYNFHPDLVSRAIPDAWEYSDPARVLHARYSAASAALQRVLPEELTTRIEHVVEIIRLALQHAGFAGRPLAAAHAALPWPQDPLLALWHACTVWREYRGDAHVAALLYEGIDPVQAHLTLAGVGGADEETLRTNRGWSPQEWEQGRSRLRRRGLLDDSGRLTEAGVEVRERVERATDALSAPPWEAMGQPATGEVIDLLREPAARIGLSGAIPVPNPMGLSQAELTRELEREGLTQ